MFLVYSIEVGAMLSVRLSAAMSGCRYSKLSEVSLVTADSVETLATNLEATSMDALIEKEKEEVSCFNFVRYVYLNLAMSPFLYCSTLFIY